MTRVARDHEHGRAVSQYRVGESLAGPPRGNPIGRFTDHGPRQDTTHHGTEAGEEKGERVAATRDGNAREDKGQGESEGVPTEQEPHRPAPAAHGDVLRDEDDTCRVRSASVRPSSVYTNSPVQ